MVLSGVKCDVLVTHGWGRIGYNVVRSLGRRGLRVALGTDRFRGMAVASRYVASTFRHPFFITETDAFVAAVADALRRYAPKVLLPTNEDTYVVARHIDRLQAGAAIPIAPFDVLATLHRKDDVVALARSLGVPVPETISPANESEIRAFCREFGPRVVVKRISSAAARGVYYATEEQIVRAWNGDGAEMLPTSGVILQQFVEGSSYGVSMLFNQGQLRAAFSHKRLAEKTRTGGVSTVRVGVAQPALELHARRILEAVRYHGVAMVEFKRNDRSGQCWLLEVNPRFWGSVGLAIQSGVDFPYLLYRLAAEGDVAPVTTYREGLVVKWLTGDWGASLYRSRLGGSIRTDGYDDFYWDDPLPFLVGGVLSIRKYLATSRLTPDALDLDIGKLSR